MSQRSNPPFHFLARAIILKDGRLLVNRFAGTSFTFLPEGHIEPGEGLHNALKRKLAEELGVDVIVGAYLGAVEYLWHNSTGQRQYEVNHVFEATVTLGQTVRSLDPNLQFHWASLDELEAFDLRPEPLRHLLPRWVRGESQSVVGNESPLSHADRRRRFRFPSAWEEDQHDHKGSLTSPSRVHV